MSGAPPSSTVWVSAVADTGATGSCISAAAAARAGLILIGEREVTSITQATTVNVYLGTLWIRAAVEGVPFTWSFENRTFMEFGTASPDCDALLGMDILSLGLLAVNGPAKTTTFAW